ncbi:S-adenosylmethionine/S-adenosylhomocysteine transporter [Anaerolineae bacterium]|nr:S-adenosylmethionine/S-adenosylhomocysteine transporter [Anaerolineae bacterium]
MNKLPEARPRAIMRAMLKNGKPSHTVAVIEALIVNLIWASSFVLVKIGLNYAGALSLAGLRYFSAFLLLVPLLARDGKSARVIPRRWWIYLFLIGACAYLIGNGALFWGLQSIPATTGSLMLSLIPVPVFFMGIVWLKEKPTWLQTTGLAVALAGSALFFSPGLTAGDPLAVAIVAAGLIGFAFFGILGREVARDGHVDTLPLTAFPLAFGGGLLLFIALPLEGLPKFSWELGGIILWLALVNTAIAYLLYNHALQLLTALEMNVLNNLAPLVTAMLAWIFLGEVLQPIQLGGIIVVIVGVVLVQWRNGKSSEAHVGD